MQTALLLNAARRPMSGGFRGDKVICVISRHDQITKTAISSEMRHVYRQTDSNDPPRPPRPLQRGDTSAKNSQPTSLHVPASPRGQSET